MGIQRKGRMFLVLFLGLALIMGGGVSCSAPATPTATSVSPSPTSFSPTSPSPTPSSPVSPSPTQTVSSTLPKPAEPATIQYNAELANALPFADRQDFTDAQRGFVASLPNVTILAETGTPVWTLKGYEFLQQKDPPPSINPSLWRMAQLNMNNGLFKVTDRVFQIRGFDMSNMTIIEGDTGLILIDPLQTAQTSKAGLNLYFQQFGEKPVIAVIYTHSHVDHYGGVKGVISEADVKADIVQVLAPEGFLEAAISENVYAGTAMTRRASLQYGLLLPRGELGQVDVGIGKASAVGSITLIPPTDIIKNTGETRTIDGVEIEFQIVSGTEAPAEMNLYFPQFKVLDSAEIACPLLHNILTLRGAQVRDAKKWAACLNEDIALYGDKTEVLIAQHNWPRWGQENVVNYLANQRDLYQFVNDQTLNLINKGYTPIEIAEAIQLPASLDTQWYTHGYYGTLSHNVKAVYQKYIGWYDGNPANLNPLTPVEAAKKFVAYMGGAQAIIDKARQDFAKGEYRWVAQVLNQVVFAEPDNALARYLEADALEQMGYQAESGIWRNIYLSGAWELRNGIPKAFGTGGTANADTITAMTIPLFFDYWGIRLNAAKADGKTIILNWNFTDTGEQYALNLSNCALTYRADWQDPKADAGFTLARATLDNVTLGQTTFEQALSAGNIKVVGTPQKLAELLGMLDTFSPFFSIVVP